MNKEQPLIEKSEILKGIKEQIVAFDNKASILIAVLGVIFALSFSALELFITHSYGWWVYLFFSFYILSLIMSISLSLCVILPRERRKAASENITNSCTYYGDLKDMTEEEFDAALVKETHFEQIKTNACIAWRKHKFIRAAIYSLIPLGVFFVILIITLLV